MATSDTEIINLALSELGTRLVTSIDEESKPARTAKATYDFYRDFNLVAYPWNFAMKRVVLLLDDFDPAWGTAGAYKLPIDILRVKRVNNSERWRVEGKFFVPDDQFQNQNYNVFAGNFATNSEIPESSDPGIEMLYIARIEDPSLFSPSFIESFSLYLAYRWCIPLTADSDRKKELFAQYKDALAMARSFDGQEGIPDDLVSDSWSEFRGD